MELQNAFESLICLDQGKVLISKFDEYDIAYNKQVGYIDDYFNFSNNSVSIHLLKKKFEASGGLRESDVKEVQVKVNKLVEDFERLDLKKFPMPVLLETLGKRIEEEIKINIQCEISDKKYVKRKNYYLLLLIIYNKEKIKSKLLEDYKILLLLNKIQVPEKIEDIMKKENFQENYMNPLINLLSDFYVRNEFVTFYSKIVNIYFLSLVIKSGDGSAMSQYTVTPKLFVEKSIVKLTAKLTKKAFGWILPCVKKAFSLNPLALPITYAVIRI